MIDNSPQFLGEAHRYVCLSSGPFRVDGGGYCQYCLPLDMVCNHVVKYMGVPRPKRGVK